MCLMLGWAILNPFILVKNRNLKNSKRETALNDTQVYLVTVQPEGPCPQTRNKTGSEAAANGRSLREAAALPWRGGGDTAVCPASSDGQILGCGSRANLAINFQVSANKLSKHLCLYQGREGKRIHECWQFCRIHPEPVLDGHGSQPGRGGARYHSFFFSSMETPPGPRATTRSKPPITDMVWKKSYFRKSCMGL